MPRIAHVVLFKLKPQASPAATAELKKAIDALRTVPGPISAFTGPPAIEGRTQGYDYGLYSVFESREALDKYAVADSHLDVVKTFKPRVDSVLAYDFTLDN